MRKLLYTWRYYSFGQEWYQECMDNIFYQNLNKLCQMNIIVAIFAFSFSFFPIVIERDIGKAGVYLAATLIAVFFAVYTHYSMQKQRKSNLFIYTLITLFYANIMLFGIYLSVWSNTGKIAAVFLIFLIIALQMFFNPPLFNLCLTLAAMAIFIVSTIIMKTPENWVFDVVNAVIAGVLGLYFNWHISKLRLGLEISATMLEEDRNMYFDQSTIDELTQLRNRRDFMQTFQRYLSTYRTSDDWLCVAICDIDFFKKYNDRYGHPMGDDCLRAVGRVLNGLMESFGVYSARVGGEEFALLWFEKDASQVDAVASHIINSIIALKIPHDKSSVAPYVTISVGVYKERCGTASDSKNLYDLADKTLYSAKVGGRNCAIIRGNGIEEYKITPDRESA